VRVPPLLSDVRTPAGGPPGAPDDWVLLDASLTRSPTVGGSPPWDRARARAADLERQGWQVVPFGGDQPPLFESDPEPSAPRTLLAPMLDRAAEAGVRRVRVLSDFRLEDAVAVRSALEALPLELQLESVGAEALMNAGVSALDIPDVGRPSDPVRAVVEIHVAHPADSEVDSVTVRVLEEGTQVAQVRVPAPSPGLRARVRVDLPPASATGRVRYTATVTLEAPRATATGADAFPSDDEAVTYASVGHEEGALVLVSLRPDWEPRYLLPLLEDVTGLPSVGYLRAGPDRFLPMGRAPDRGSPVDSATVRAAASAATLFVLHGLGRDADSWARSLTRRAGRTVLLPSDAEGALVAGIPSGEPRAGEWYASGDIPMSPIAGSLAGVTLQDLPPLTDVLLPTDPARVRGALLLQLRGAGTPEAALQLDEREGGRVAVGLAQGFWRWAARDDGRDVYRRLWSGVAGWLLAGEGAAPLEVRPTRWVVPRGEPVLWSVPPDSVPRTLVVSHRTADRSDSVTWEGELAEQADPSTLSTGVLPPGSYAYRVESSAGTPLAEGRFDVAAATLELASPSIVPPSADGDALTAGAEVERPGSPLRTRPWPYLLVIGLLCAEWIGRRRSGLR
jgi:hypothetical protein